MQFERQSVMLYIRPSGMTPPSERGGEGGGVGAWGWWVWCPYDAGTPPLPSSPSRLLYKKQRALACITPFLPFVFVSSAAHS